MEEIDLLKITEQEKNKYQDWWNGLSDNWKKAINQAAFQKGEITDDLSIDEIHDLWHSVAFRIAGPKAMFPNLSFEIGDLEGVKALKGLKILIVMNSGIKSIKSISRLINLESLFVMDNELKTLDGVENMVNLKQFYFQNNKVISLEPLKNMTDLEDILAYNNQIKDLKGITEKHSDKLLNFRILPNSNLHQREIIKLESKVGIRCLRG
ncbi:MAG: hypothetical protein ACJA1N_000021 [Saprospiraceae bacterium]|jgi:hypothetical protein